MAAKELCTGLLDGILELAVMVQPAEYSDGTFEFEELQRYPFCVAAAPGHPFKRLKAVPLEKLAGEPMVSFNRYDYSEHFRILNEIFSPKKLKPRITVEVDGASSLITEVESGRGVAVVSKPFQRVAGKRLIYRQIIAHLPRIKSAPNEYNKRRLTMSEQAGRSAEDSKSDLLHFAPFRAQAVVHGTLPDRIINRYYKKPL